ncbi:hypothetical protein QFC19_001618 [Naganishia cerealis]|uniref:Uncharacterized protein n=1 Tax=Naganishia cerealis TaxID=610337 RepID=A0ACC2WIV3_9TREE|nr:hypothetical protein QFC19_001618 [Naganishia cerealis]
MFPTSPVLEAITKACLADAYPGIPPATNIIKSLLVRRGPLKAQQLYDLGLKEFPTETVRNPLPGQPDQVYLPDGSVRMRKAANVRGGKTPWKPMPTAPHPDHPFQSMNYFKQHLLEPLEVRGLVQKKQVLAPLKSGVDKAAAVAHALKITRRRQREKAEELGLGSGFRLTKQDIKNWEAKVYSLPVERVQPETMKKEWVYTLEAPGVKEEELQKLVQAETALCSSPTSTTTNPDIVPPNVELDATTVAELDPEPDYPAAKAAEYRSIISHPRVAARWDAAVQAEEAAFKLEQMNKRAIEERRAARREMWQAAKKNLRHKEQRELNWLKERQGTDQKVDKILRLKLAPPDERQKMIERERFENATKRLADLRKSFGLKTLVSLKPPPLPQRAESTPTSSQPEAQA